MKNKFFISLLFLLFLSSFVTHEKSFSENSFGTGIILGDIVNVRKLPKASSEVLETVIENEKVTILEWSAKFEKIGKFEDKWVKVKTKTGKVGYLFGAFIFDLNELYKKPWIKMVDSRSTITGGDGDVFNFHLNDDILLTITKGYNYITEEKGKVTSLSGRKITINLLKSTSFQIKDPPLDNTRINVVSSVINKTVILYLFKSKGVHFVIGSNRNINFELPLYNHIRFESIVNFDVYKQES